jgi:hypothetical protein
VELTRLRQEIQDVLHAPLTIQAVVSTLQAVVTLDIAAQMLQLLAQRVLLDITKRPLALVSVLSSLQEAMQLMLVDYQQILQPRRSFYAPSVLGPTRVQYPVVPAVLDTRLLRQGMGQALKWGWLVCAVQGMVGLLIRSRVSDA